MLLEKQLIEKILDTALETGADFSEVFVENRKASVLQSVSGRLEKSNNSHTFGVGIRVAKQVQSVYGYTNSKNPDDLIQLARNLSKSFHDENLTTRTPLMPLEVGKRHRVKIKPSEMTLKDKVSLLKRSSKAASDYDDVIKQVFVNLVDDEQEVLIANSEGRFVTETRVRVRIATSSIASDNGVMQTGFASDGSGKGYEFFDECDIEAIAKEASRIAKTMLYADDCPSGVMPVIIHNEFGGVIFHEACGHSLEATSVAKNASVFSGKKGTKIASDIVTAIDDGTIENGWGSANFDDEGYPQQRRVLIKNGILNSYMVDKINGRRMNEEATGSSRRQNYKFSPTSRMSNTFIDNGTSTLEEMIAATDYGLFAKRLGGGSVNPGNGDFNFSVMEGYMIRDGKIAEPVKGAALVGNGATILHEIDMVGNNLSRQRGMCGSASGTIPADVGQPSIRVKAITVGGKKKGEH